MQRKGIMLIVFLECFISGHGEAGKSNKSILPFVKQFILSWASRKGIEIKSVKHSNSFLCLNHYLDWIWQEIWASECIQVFLTICNILLYSSASSQRLSIGSTVSYILKIILRSIFFFLWWEKNWRGGWIEICWIFVLRKKHCFPRQDKNKMTRSLDSTTEGIWIFICNFILHY